jgi:signal transduction histidine kinase
MNLTIISEDRALYSLCREVVSETGGQWLVSLADQPGRPPERSTLYIWDYRPAAGALAARCFRERPLFLVDRRDLAGFRAIPGAEDANVLLKPPTRAALAAFLDFNAATRRERPVAEDALRADRDNLLQCLIETNLRLQEYDQDRTNFLARAVHDFRAPLTALSGYCGLLLNEPVGSLNANQREAIRRMQRSAARLSRMATAMFQLSVGHRVELQPALREGDVRNCVEQSLHEIGPFVEEKRIAVTASMTPCEGALYFDAVQLEQLLVNVLDNACKFTPKAGSIEIRGYPYFWERRVQMGGLGPVPDRRRGESRAPNAYRIDIEDSGEPIPPEHLEMIFEEYTSYGGGKDRSGGGLGLAICRMIASRHGGRIWASNTDLGPRFSLVLPAAASKAAPDVECRVDTECLEEANRTHAKQ